MDRDAKLQELRDKRERWMRERQAEMDRERVMAELAPPDAGRSLPQQLPHGPASGLSNYAYSQSAATSVPINGAAAAARPGQQQPGVSMGPGPSHVAARAMPAAGGMMLARAPGVRPEQVIDKLTERITERLRDELRVELQRESEGWQARAAAQGAALDGFLAKELEAQNSCPICYELMVPPHRAPQLLVPCGHTFCTACTASHIDTNHKSHCPLCREKIKSRAPNYSLQQLIAHWVARKEKVMQGGGVGSGVGDGAAGGAGGGGGAADEGCAEETADQLRRRGERMALRLRVLRNELLDVCSQQQALEARVEAAVAVEAHLAAEEADVVARLKAVQAELDLVRDAQQQQAARTAEARAEASRVAEARGLLAATITPLEAECAKLEMLLEGVGAEGTQAVYE